MQCVEMEVGDVMLIHGALDHMSRENTSEFSRRSFQIHLVEGREDAQWDPLNVCRRVEFSSDCCACIPSSKLYIVEQRFLSIVLHATCAAMYYVRKDLSIEVNAGHILVALSGFRMTLGLSTDSSLVNDFQQAT